MFQISFVSVFDWNRQRLTPNSFQNCFSLFVNILHFIASTWEQHGISFIRGKSLHFKIFLWVDIAWKKWVNTIQHKNKQIDIRSRLQRKVMMMRDIDQQNCKFTLMKAGYFCEGSELIFFLNKRLLLILTHSLIPCSGQVVQSRVSRGSGCCFSLWFRRKHRLRQKLKRETKSFWFWKWIWIISSPWKRSSNSFTKQLLRYHY